MSGRGEDMPLDMVVLVLLLLLAHPPSGGPPFSTFAAVTSRLEPTRSGISVS
jgi:hypothetical protein